MSNLDVNQAPSSPVPVKLVASEASMLSSGWEQPLATEAFSPQTQLFHSISDISLNTSCGPINNDGSNTTTYGWYGQNPIYGICWVTYKVRIGISNSKP